MSDRATDLSVTTGKLARAFDSWCREPAESREPSFRSQGLDSLRTLEARYTLWASAHFDLDRRALARELGISERTLYRRLAEARVASSASVERRERKTS